MTLKTRLRIVVAAALSLAWLGACGESGSSDGGDTHWLGRCDRNTQCPSGVECWCGLCTQACAGDGACAKGGGACFEVASPGISDRCADMPLPKATGICLGLCKTSDDCVAGSECLLGACVPKPADARDAGSVGEGGSGGATHRRDGGLPRATDFADVEIPADFTDPTVVPQPEPTISGDAAQFIGKWIARNEFAPCSGMLPCRHLEIVQGPNGGVIGTVTVDPQDPPQIPQGPFARATDPAHGYPVGVDPKDYFALRSNIVGGVPYRILEGQVHGHVIDFWVSSTDVWTDWCALQKPHLWKLGTENRYRAVPQTATLENTDLGLYALASTAWDGPICKASGETDYPCSCLDATQTPVGSPECAFYAPVCDCNADECHADLRSNETYNRLELQGDQLVGEFLPSVWATNSTTTLVRETP